MKKLLTEPEKDIEALLRCDKNQRQNEEIQRLLADLGSSKKDKTPGRR
jgi:type II secretory pathway predicted ATPase ExeA